MIGTLISTHTSCLMDEALSIRPFGSQVCEDYRKVLRAFLVMCFEFHNDLVASRHGRAARKIFRSELLEELLVLKTRCQD